MLGQSTAAIPAGRTFVQVRGLARSRGTLRHQSPADEHFHLMQKAGATTVKSLGGLHAMSGWEKAIFTDSGGFQAYSLIRQGPRFGQFSDNGLVFKPEDGGRKYQLTPEKCIQLQLGFGSDLLFCLDDCTHIDEEMDQQEASVERTIRWAKRCRVEFDRLLDEKRLEKDQRPKLFAVVQGGNSPNAPALREALLRSVSSGTVTALPLDSQCIRLKLDFSARVDPAEFHMPRSARPPALRGALRGASYGLFDSAMPTRDAPHGRLYRFNYQPDKTALVEQNDWFGYVYAHDERI